MGKDSAVSAEQRVCEYYANCWGVFQRAIHAVPESEVRFYQIGELVFRLQFAGPALASRIAPALQHLAIAPTPSLDLTIGLWDSASTGFSIPPPTSDPTDFIARTEIRGFQSEQIQITYDIGGGALNLLNLQSNTALYWIREAVRTPYYESGSPLRAVFAAWLQSRRYQLLHAAAVGTERGAVILAGKSGSGKSTTALNCLRAGLLYLSDDYCVAGLTPQPTVYSLYSSGKLRPESIEQFPQLSYLYKSIHSDTEKLLFFLNEGFSRQIPLSLPIRAILLPRITSETRTHIVPATAAEGLTALAPSTVFQLPFAGKTAFQSMAQLVRSVPIYQLNLGAPWESIPDVIRDFLDNPRNETTFLGQ
jgi:hypothetical protein